MTNEELAERWGCSLQDVKRISDVMNHHYYLGVSQDKDTALWHGVLYEFENNKGKEHLRSKKGFKTPQHALHYWNKLSDLFQIPNELQQEFQLPKDAFKALAKIPESVCMHHRSHCSGSRSGRVRD